jgi:hypothetical protein
MATWNLRAVLEPWEMQEVAQEIFPKKKRKTQEKMARRCWERPEEDEGEGMDREDEE